MTDIESLYKRYAPDVRQFVLFLSGDPVIADEITSDAFMSAWLASERIRQPTVPEIPSDFASTVASPALVSVEWHQ